MLPSWAHDTITRIRPAMKESRGSTIQDWSKPNRLSIFGCSMQPTTTSLSQDGRVLGVMEGFTCYLPPGSDVIAGDRIEYNGNIYSVIGEPQPWTSPTGRMSNLQVQLERWRG